MFAYTKEDDRLSILFDSAIQLGKKLAFVKDHDGNYDIIDTDTWQRAFIGNLTKRSMIYGPFYPELDEYGHVKAVSFKVKESPDTWYTEIAKIELGFRGKYIFKKGR